MITQWLGSILCQCGVLWQYNDSASVEDRDQVNGRLELSVFVAVMTFIVYYIVGEHDLEHVRNTDVIICNNGIYSLRYDSLKHTSTQTL